MPFAETWRVVLADDETRDVVVEPWETKKYWRALLRTASGAVVDDAVGATQRAAVTVYTGDRGWAVCEILAPGESSRMELVAVAAEYLAATDAYNASEPGDSVANARRIIANAALVRIVLP